MAYGSSSLRAFLSYVDNKRVWGCGDCSFMTHVIYLWENSLFIIYYESVGNGVEGRLGGGGGWFEKPKFIKAPLAKHHDQKYFIKGNSTYSR